MKIFLRDHNRVTEGLEKHFEVVKFNEAEKVVLWQDTIGEGLGLAKLAHLKRKPVIQIQHGRYAYRRYGYPFNQKMISDKICAWGIRDKERLIRFGVPKEKIEVTGTTVFSHLKPRKKHKGTNIVFSPDHWDLEDMEENARVAEVLKKIKGVSITTKIIETHDVTKYDNWVLSHRDSPEHLDICADILREADILVSISEGTFELLAQAMDIPVVIANIFTPRPSLGDRRYFKYRLWFSEAVKKTPELSELPKLIRDQLKNPDELKKERRIVAIEDGGINIKDPLKNIVNVIRNI